MRLSKYLIKIGSEQADLRKHLRPLIKEAKALENVLDLIVILIARKAPKADAVFVSEALAAQGIDEVDTAEGLKHLLGINAILLIPPHVEDMLDSYELTPLGVSMAKEALRLRA